MYINIIMKCKWPLNHLSISSTGVYRPCCAWQESEGQPLVATNTLQDYLNSNFYKDIINDLSNGRFAKGCEECVLDEQAGVDGMVHSGNFRYPDKTEFSVYDMEIKFGNICNAGCIMCSAYNSSLIEEENKKNSELLKYRRNFTSPTGNWFEDPEKFEEIAILASQCKKIRFTGGEPTVRGLVDDFLAIVAKHSTKPLIQLTSNGSSFGGKLQECLQQFDKVNMNLSIDGFDKANDFIRWPIKWKKLTKNIDKMQSYKNIHCNVETSLQAGSLHKLDKLVEFCNERNLDWNPCSVYSPEYLQPFLANEEIIEKAMSLGNKKVNKLLVYNSGKQKKEILRSKMIRYYDTLSKVRGIDWKECFDV